MATDSAKTVKGVPRALITSKMASTNETTKLSFLTPSVCSVCSSQNNKIQRFSKGCRKTKTKAISLANQTSHQKQRTSQNACNGRHVMENAKTSLVLLLIRRESGARFFNQSESEVNQNQNKRESLSTLN